MKNKKIMALFLTTALFFLLFSNLMIKEKTVMAKSENGIVVLKLNSDNDDEQGLRYSLDERTYLAKVTGQSILDYDADVQIPDAVEDENGIVYRVNEMANDLFKGCTMIRSLRLSESIATFDFKCIDNSSCEELYLGQNASTIYPGGTSKLTKISVSSFNTCLVMEDGVLFNKDKTILMKAPYKMEQVTTYNVPDSVNYIYDGAFKGVKYDYTWENQQEEKEYITFYLDENNKDEQGLSYKYSGGKVSVYVAKDDEVDIEELVIPDYVYFNGNSYRSSVVSISGGVGKNTKKMSIGSNVREIEYSVFSEAHSLETIELDSRNKYFYIDEQGVLFSIIKDVVYRAPRSLESFICPEEVVKIGPYCFAYTKIKDIEFNPNKLYLIRSGAFAQTDVTQLCLQNALDIGSYAFEKCTKLKWVVLGSRKSVIYDAAFQNCSRLEAVFLPNIGFGGYLGDDGAFYNCVSLKKSIMLKGRINYPQTCFHNTKVEYMVIPEGCTGIMNSLGGGTPYVKLDYLKEIYFPKDCEVREFLDDSSGIKAYYPPGGTTEENMQRYLNSDRVTPIVEKEHEHTYETHVIYDANGLTISAERCTDCYKQVSYRAETPDGTVISEYDFYKEPIVQSIVKNHSGSTSDSTENTPSPTPSADMTSTATPSPSASALPTVTPSPSPTQTSTATPSPSASAAPTATPSPSVSAAPTATPSPSTSATPTATPNPGINAKPTVSPLSDADVKSMEGPRRSENINATGHSATGESEKKQGGTKQLSSAKNRKLKTTPIISVKKKHSGKIKYIHIRLKKYQGTYIEVYAGKKNKLRKIGGKAFSIKKYKKSLNVKYSKKKQVLYIKVRTYKKIKNKKIYSRYSKTIKVRT